MRLIFIASSLERGGLEHEVEATVRLALNAEHEVKLFTPYKARDDAAIRRNLQRLVPLDSAQEQWRRSPRGRALLQAARLKHVVTRFRRPRPADEVHLARRFVPRPEVARFWDDQARRMLAGGDLLHLFGKPKPFLARAARQARTLGLKVIYEEASQVTPEYASRRDHQHFAIDSALCDVIVARCERHGQSIRSQYHYSGPIRLIEQWAYGAEDDLLAIARCSPPRSRPFVFGTIARLDEGKGIDTILQAFARVRRAGTSARLRIAGTGESEGALRLLAADLSIDPAPEFVGYLEGAEKTALYASLDAFVLASRDEGGPITGVEAMAAALPIISTPVGAMPERLGDGTEALFFEPGSTEQLAAAMIRLATEDGLESRLGDAGRRRYCQRNHSRVCAAQKTALWSELGDRRRRGACP